MKPMRPPFCLWEEYQRTGEYRDMLHWLKHRAYCYATEPEWDEVAPRLLEAAACFQLGDAALMGEILALHREFEKDYPDENPGWSDLFARMTKAAEIIEGKE